MSDFTSNFWAMWVAVITVVSIVACLVLLWFSGKARAMTASDNTTGHVWDGDLREMNNPLPRWWAYLFVITIIFAFAYLALYPGLGTFQGKLGWSSAGQHQLEVKRGNEEVAPLYAKFAVMTPEALAANAPAMAVGERLYMNNCAQCHASDARGNKGFPNLTDADWLGGGSHDVIKTNILQGRMGMMPPMAAAVGSADDVKNVAQYVLSLSGSPNDSVRAQLGKAKFASCAACHGLDGKGNQTIGAPNLTDDIWLHGYGEAAIVSAINKGITNQMPAQDKVLTPEQIHVLAAYVWSFSNKSVVAAK